MVLRNAKLYRAAGVVALSIFATAVSVQAQTATWSGNGSSDNSGNWENGANWTGGAGAGGIPAATDNASLLNVVAAGTRNINISSGSPETINQLTMTQTTVGQLNVLNVNDNLTISGNSNPFAITATAGQGSIVTNIAASETLLATNAGGLTGSFGGTLNLSSGSLFELQTTGSTNDMGITSFAGPINATGAGANILLSSGRFDPSLLTFNGALTTIGSGSTLTLQVNQQVSVLSGAGTTTFNGNDGSGNSINAAAGTQVNIVVAQNTYNFTNAVNLSGTSGSTAAATMTLGLNTSSSAATTNFNGGLILGAGAKFTNTFGSPAVNLFGTSTMAAGSTLLLQYDTAQGNDPLVNNGNFTVNGATISFDNHAGNNNPGTLGRSWTNTGTWNLNSSTMDYTESGTANVPGGFGAGQKDFNSGTLNVTNGSFVASSATFNTGTLNLGSNNGSVSDPTVTLGGTSADGIYSTGLTNGTTPTGAAGAGTINFNGNTFVGNGIANGQTMAFKNGSASSTGSVINVGGTVATSVIVSGYNVALTNYAGNTLIINPSGKLTLQYTAAQGSGLLTNNGTFNVSSGTVYFDFAATSNNSGNPRTWVNSGTWNLNNSTVDFISSTGKVPGGFGAGANAANSGTMNVTNGSTVGFLTLFNTGTMNLGSNNGSVSDPTVTLGATTTNSFAGNNSTLTNGLTPTLSHGAGTINFNGNTFIGNAGPPNGNVYTMAFNNGSDSSVGGSVINIGGTVATSVIVNGYNVALTNSQDNTLNINPSGKLTLQWTGAQGSGSLVNEGTFNVSSGTVYFDFAASSNNNGSPRTWVNSGTWNLNNSTVDFISSTGKVPGGFGGGTNAANSGTMNVTNGSTVGFVTLFNTGTMNLGSNNGSVSDPTVTLGATTTNSFAGNNSVITNGLTPAGAAAPGTINFNGNVNYGFASGANNGPTTTFNNGSSSSTGSVVNVGNGTVSTLVTIANYGVNNGNAVAVNNFAGNTININANGTLFLDAVGTGTSSNSVIVTNNGTMVQAGTLEMRSNFGGFPSVSSPSGSVYQISGTSAGWINLSNNGPSSNSNLLTVAGTLSGATAADTLTYTNSGGNSSLGLLTIKVPGTISPGNGLSGVGTLTFVNSTLDLTGGTYAAQVGAGVADNVTVNGSTTGAGNLTLSGTTLALTDNANQNGQGYATAGSYPLITYGGTRTGTFSTVTNAMSSTLHESIVYGGSNSAVTLNLYRLASPTVTSPVTLPITHVGGTFASTSLTVANTAANDGFSEGLNAAFGSLSGVSSNGGSVTNLAGGSSDTSSMTVSLTGSTAYPGIVSGTAQISLASNAGSLNAYGITPLTSQTVTVNGQVNQYAQPQITFNTGAGTLTGSGTSYTLNLGAVAQGSGILASALNILNNELSTYQDTLSGSTFSLSGSGFTLTGNSNFSGVLPGNSQGLGVSFDSSQSAASYVETMTFTPSSDNASSSTPLSPISLELDASISGSGGAANLTWNNAGATAPSDGLTWDTTNNNWNNGTSVVAYSDTSNTTSGDNVTFTEPNNGNYNVSIPSVVHPTSTTVNASGNYVFYGAGGIGGPGGLTKLGTGALALNTSNSYTGPTNISGGVITLGLATTLPAGTNLTISGAGSSLVASNLGGAYALKVGTLSISGGTVDLMNNALVVHSGTLTAVNSLVQAGYNGGAWNGSTGIVSSSAANNVAHLTALGVIQNSTDGTTGGPVLYSTFDGQTGLVAGDVLVKYTYYGDANLDGKVDGTDYSRIDNSYLSEQSGPSISGWYNGDFNYDGVVNGSDYTLIDNAFNSQGAQIAAEIATPTAQIAGGSGSSAVPEPTTLGLLGIGAIGLLGRRKRRWAH